MPIDRIPSILTSYRVPTMRRPQRPVPERDSIYGDTYDGVPNPMVPHVHPYPTRYHGAKFDYPQPGYEYVGAPYARGPFAGFGAEPFFGKGTSFTGYTLLDALIGAGLGYIASPKPDAAIVHAAVGGLSAMAFGAPGMVVFLAAEVLLTHQELGRRKDIGALSPKAKSKIAG